MESLIHFESASQDKLNNKSLIAGSNVESNSSDKSVQLIGSNVSTSAIWQSLISSYAHTDINLRKSGYTAINFNELLLKSDGDIKIFLSDDMQLIKANQNQETAFISPSLDKLEEIIEVENDTISVLAVQKHLCKADSYQQYINQKFNFLRLSDINRDVSLVEVLLRNAENIYFDLDAIKLGELGEINIGSICGLSMMEACQMMKYIGSLSHLKNLQLHSVKYEIETDKRYYECISLLIWYFLEGMTLKSKPSTSGVPVKKEYVVYPENEELPLFFYNEFDTQKWWCRTNPNSDPIACSPVDYELAKSGVFTDRVTKIVESYS